MSTIAENTKSSANKPKEMENFTGFTPTARVMTVNEASAKS